MGFGEFFFFDFFSCVCFWFFYRSDYRVSLGLVEFLHLHVDVFLFLFFGTLSEILKLRLCLVVGIWGILELGGLDSSFAYMGALWNSILAP